MADVSRSGYLSRKLAGINDESSKHIYDGIFSAPAAAKHNGSTFAARIDDYREIFPPSKASLGSSIPILDLPAVDRSVGPGRALSSGFDYTGVFGGFGDSDGIQVPSEKLFCDSQKTAKRDAQLPRIPAQMRRMPSKSQEFSCSYGNDQTSGSGQMMRIPSKSQEFSCNYENDQTSSLAQARRIPSKSQEFSCNYGNYQTSSPVQTRRMPSKSPEFSCKNGNDQTSSPAQMRSIPSKSQDFSCNNVIDQTSSAVQLRRMPSKSQEFSCNYGNDETSNLVQPRRMPSKSQEFQCNYGNNQTSSTVQPRSMPSIGQEVSCNYGNDQASNTVQLRSMPSISQEVSCNYGTDQASSPMQQRRMPSKSQEFSIDYGNDQTSTPAQTRMQYSKSQEFSSNLSNNQMSTSPVETRGPFSRDDEVSGTSPNDQTSISAVSQQAVNNAKHVSVSYHKTNQLSKDGTNGTTHIAHLPAVPGYTLLFDEAGPVRKTGFDKAKRLSMDDADFSAAADKVSKQGKHTRAVSDLGTNQQVNLKAQACSMSVSNSPQSFGSSDYFKRSSSRRPNRSTSKLRRNGPRESSPVLEDELDVNSAAAISAAAMKKAIEVAEGKIRWAKAFLKELEGNGFIKPTLRDSFKVKVASGAEHSYETCGLNQNGTSKVKAARKKKCFNEEEGLKQNSYLNSKASDEHIHANEAGEIPPKVRLDIPSQNQPENEAAGSEKKLHAHATGMDAAAISPSTETFETTNAHHELKSAERSCKHEGGGEWEAAKHLSQLFTGVKNRFVSFMSKQADSEKTVTPKDAPSKCESLEKPEDRAHEVRNVDPNKEREAGLEHIEEKVEMDHSRCSVGGESAQDSTRISLDVEIDEAKENEVNASGSTLSPDIEVFTSKQCRPSAPAKELEYIQVQELASRANGLDQVVFPEVEGERLQEVREQNGEILDATVKIEHESQIGTLGLEEHDKAYDDEVRNWGVNGEAANEVPGLDPEMKSLDESLTHEVVTSRQVEGCNLKEIKMPTNALTKQEDVRMIEKTCRVEERYARVVGTEEISCGGEDIGRIAGQDITGETTEGASHVVDDVSEHDEHLAATDYMTDQDELFVSKNKEASMPYITNQYVECMNFSSEEKGRKATTPFEPKENVEPPQPVERASELIGEGICEETHCSVDVVDDDSEHDEYLPAVDDILEQDELLSSSRNGVTIVPEAVSQYASYVDLPLQKERLTEATSTTSAEPDGGRIEKSGSVQMTDELNGEYKSEGSGFNGEAVDQFLEHDDYFPVADDVCEKNEHPCFNRNVITCDQDENQHAEEGKVAVVAERSKKITTGAGASEFGGKEQPSSRQMANEFISEEETEKLMSARDRLDMDNMEKVIEEAHEASPSTYVEITECYTTFKFDQKHSVQETMNFAADIGPQIQDEESEVITREANEADEQDVSSHSGESSHKRRRWFENREKTGEFQQPVFFQGNERTLEMDPENTEGSTVEDRVEICVDETVNNSGEGVIMEQAGGGSDQDGEDLHSSEGSHRRRRWFENNGGKSQHSPLNGVGVTAEMNREIGQEYKHDVGSRSDTDNLVNERKDGADGMESSNLASDEAECRASTEAASHRRRRWFENGEVLGAAAQRPGSILEDSEATAARGDEIKVGADTTKQELREISSSEDLGNTHQSEGRSKEREKEKERLAVERAIREARQRAFAEARERAAAEARLKAAAATQDRSGKASCETKPLPDKASMDAKLRAERAAVERATAEARERALQKAMFEKFTYNSREKDPTYPNSGPSSSSGYSTDVPFTSDRSDGSITESPERKKAISERNKRTMERAAKALEEKNLRDVVAQKEQAERNRFAGVLDAEVKRWSTGKEGNLRSLLSTLQYILGPDSGWQPIPLTDLVTTTAVRKAYKRAALCVHPDKLQQRRATVQHKYICEKVFDLLKDAWQKLNPDDR